MKKALSVLLALVMCLSLCACGNKATGSMESQNNFENNAHPSTEPVYEESIDNITENTDNALIDHPLLPYLYGQWEMQGESITVPNPFSLLIINEDGTCIADGKECTWTIFDASTKDLFIDILSDSVKIGGLVLWGNSEDDTLDGFTAMGEMDYTFCDAKLVYTPISDENSK